MALLFTRMKRLAYNRLYMEQIIKTKLVGLREIFNTFDVSELVYEEANKNYRIVNSTSESW